jgi:hypothetical protein
MLGSFNKGSIYQETEHWILIQTGCKLKWYDIFVNCNLLTPGGSSTIHIYTPTVHRMTKKKQTIPRTAQKTIHITTQKIT